MKHYVLMQLIHGSGGVQCYLAAKAKWLEENGWHVVVISSCSPHTTEKCLLSYLNKYILQGNIYTAIHPSNLPKWEVRKQLRKMMKSVGHVSFDDSVIIESWNSPTAQWSELLASRIHGRHLFWMANEQFRKPGQQYESKIDFYKFKMDRGEILTSVGSANLLFEGYRKYEKGNFLVLPISEDPIQDVDYDNVNSIVKQDWNIIYIGRDNKPYVPNVFRGVGVFAKKHLDKKIQFIIVGKISVQRGLLDSINLPNLTITELGDLYPMPRNLYSKIDVVIAGSGSARHSVDEGALVISTDTETCRSHGILGYDTQESISVSNIEASGELDLSFDEALERALVTKEWKNKSYRWERCPSVSDSMAIQEKIVANAAKELEYYDEDLLLKGKIKWLSYIKCKINELLNI